RSSPSDAAWLGSLQHGAARKELPGTGRGVRARILPTSAALGLHPRRGHFDRVARSMVHMNTNKPHREPKSWTWIVVGTVFVAVPAMLFGPFIWELTHG